MTGEVRRISGRGFTGLPHGSLAVRAELSEEQRYMLRRILEGCRRRRGCGTRRHRAINVARYKRCRRLLDAVS